MPLFRPLSLITARWEPHSGVGLEHLSIRPNGERIIVDGVIVGGRGGIPYGVRYRIVCDDGWMVERLDIDTTDGRGLHVRSDGDGSWENADGFPMPLLDGCIDVDLAGSPFTNTLPIRRTDLSPEMGAVEFKMLYVPFDAFKPIVDEQRYRCIAPGRYLYEAVDRSFSAELTVDEDGLVIDYPPLFRRVPVSPETAT